MNMDSIAILDFGSQTAQLIARRVRESQVYCELFAWDEDPERVRALHPRGYILSGGPASVYGAGAPSIPAYVLESGRPVFGICYGMQALTYTLGGAVTPTNTREYGPAQIDTCCANPLLPEGGRQVWMSHGDRVERLPEGFTILASSDNSPIAAMGDLDRDYYGVQFHPEVHHTPDGFEILRRFVVEVCGARPTWTPDSIVQEGVERIRTQVGGERVLAAVSGGVDSSVATALAHRAVGDQLVAVFVDTGLLRQGEGEQVVKVFHGDLGMELVAVDACDRFMLALDGVTDPEEKRRRIGETFIRIFEAQGNQLGHPQFLVQGTIYPDVVESRAPDQKHPGSRHITTSADFPTICVSTWLNRSVISSRMRCAWSVNR
jgi:GMP synthase (glutamine-hydrolysing)